MRLTTASTLALVSGSLLLVLPKLLRKGHTTESDTRQSRTDFELTRSPFDLDVSILNYQGIPPNATGKPDGAEDKGPSQATWSNLGFWSGTHDDYKEACKEMACRVARAADVRPGDWIADIGCGWGDQCVYFSEEFEPALIQGLNIAPRQVASVMRHRKENNGDALIQGILASAVVLPFTTDSFDRVIALDCAYHFPPRSQFFREAHRVLRQDGVLALTDVILPQKPSSLWARFLLWLTCHLSHIPYENMLDFDSYKRELESAGFALASIEYWDGMVFSGYARFIRVHESKYSAQLSGDWTTLRVTGILLGLLDRYKLLHYCLISAKKKEILPSDDVVGYAS